MSDFLKKVVETVRFITTVSPKQMIGIKDIQSNHIYCSDYLLQIMGITEKEAIGNKVHLSLYDNDPDFEKIIVDEDQKIMQSHESQTFLKINKFKNGLIPYFCQKSPLINPETNKAEGIMTQGYEIGLTHFQNHFLKKSSELKSTTDIHLTKREKQVIYFFMSHLSSQEIAEILSKMEEKSISKSTIDSVFNEQLYSKFKVYNRPDLYKKLQEAGFENKIPHELLQSGSFFLSKIEVY